MGLKHVKTRTAEYVLDFDKNTLVRRPVGGDDEYPVSELRKDEQEIPFKLLADIEVGKSAEFLLDIRQDGILTVRTTTPVVQID